MAWASIGYLKNVYIQLNIYSIKLMYINIIIYYIYYIIIIIYIKLMYISNSSSLVAPPYRGEGVWVCQGPWELYQR
jgi:hypothetical protein